jgi:hypothetical protein
MEPILAERSRSTSDFWWVDTVIAMSIARHQQQTYKSQVPWEDDVYGSLNQEPVPENTESHQSR